MYNVKSASVTHIGKVRTVNEDSVLETGNLFAVADGMGGHQAGEVASSMALNVIQQYIEDNLGVIPGEMLVEKAVAAANIAVYNKAATSSRYRDMGTTVTLLYREGDTAYIAHVGDSRAYLYREGELRRLTKDHSLVAKLVEDGEISAQEARRHPQRNIILNALGLEPRVEVDVISVKIVKGDRFLLATDGLTGEVTSESIAGVMERESEPVEIANMLLDISLEVGGADNISAIVVSFAESAAAVPVGVTRELSKGEVSVPAGRRKGVGGGKARESRRFWMWVLICAIVLCVLAAGFGVGFYFYNKTFFVRSYKGKVALYNGFPFWGLAGVERHTDIEVKFLPESLRRRVEDGLEPESREEAEKTLKSLEREAEKNSCIVPEVEGKKFNEAQRILEATGLMAVPELVSRPGIEADVVLIQDPQPGTRVGKGSKVYLKVVMGGTPPREV